MEKIVGLMDISKKLLELVSIDITATAGEDEV